VKSLQPEMRFISGDWRSSRRCTVEVFSQRLGAKSVMSVREKCDEKESRQPTAVSLQVLQLEVSGLAGHLSKSARRGTPDMLLLTSAISTASQYRKSPFGVNRPQELS
jgi:hypothetical protein